MFIACHLFYGMYVHQNIKRRLRNSYRHYLTIQFHLNKSNLLHLQKEGCEITSPIKLKILSIQYSEKHFYLFQPSALACVMRLMVNP